MNSVLSLTSGVYSSRGSAICQRLQTPAAVCWLTLPGSLINPKQPTSVLPFQAFCPIKHTESCIICQVFAFNIFQKLPKSQTWPGFEDQWLQLAWVKLKLTAQLAVTQCLLHYSHHLFTTKCNTEHSTAVTANCCFRDYIQFISKILCMVSQPCGQIGLIIK